MASRRWGREIGGLGLAVALQIGLAGEARAASDVCQPISPSPPTYAARIAAVACAENALWFAPFIDSQGRLASTSVSESERARLQDGVTPAWRRVVDYWKGSGLLWRMAGVPGASDCGMADSGYFQAASCRAFLTDTPWSAVFVSYVMNRAGVPGFSGSASHIDFIRDAYRHPQTAPYVVADPESTPPAAGDLLCFARMRETLGHQGLRAFLDGGAGQGLNMHCDIVVAAGSKGDNRLYLVGGNVLQGVTMRVLPLNRKGLVWGLPRRSSIPGDCRPGNEAACNFNRQDWAALLKLKPLPAPTAAMPMPDARPTASCCTQCPLPMPAHLRRCPASPPSDVGPETPPASGSS